MSFASDFIVHRLIFVNEKKDVSLHLLKHASVNETVLILTWIVIDRDYVQCI